MTTCSSPALTQISPVPHAIGSIMGKHDVMHKPEIHKVCQCRQRRTEPRPSITLKPRLHDTTGYQTGWVWQPCWTNSHCSFNRLYTRYSRFVKPVVKRVWQPVWQRVWQPVVSCIQTFTRLSNRFDNRFDNRLYRGNGALQKISWILDVWFLNHAMWRKRTDKQTWRLQSSNWASDLFSTYSYIFNVN